MTGATATEVNNLCAPAAQLALTERATQVSGKNRSDFIPDASCEKARVLLADRTLIGLSRQSFRRFSESIEAPLTNTDALRRLLSAPAPWERESLAIGPHLMAHSVTGTR